MEGHQGRLGVCRAKVSVCNLNPVPVTGNSMIISIYKKPSLSRLYDFWSVSASNIGRSACVVPPGDIKGAPSGYKDDELQNSCQTKHDLPRTSSPVVQFRLSTLRSPPQCIEQKQLPAQALFRLRDHQLEYVGRKKQHWCLSAQSRGCQTDGIRMPILTNPFK